MDSAPTLGTDNAAALRTAALGRIAAQWIALGGQLSGLDERTPIDLEALVAMTSQHAAAEPRTYGVAVDWCVAFGASIHVARLRTVADELQVDRQSLEQFGSDVAAAGGPRWPFATAGSSHVSRGKVVVNDLTAPSRLWWRVRSAFGVHARSDVLTILMTTPPTAVTIADLARRARYSKKNIALAVAGMSLAGIISKSRVGNEDRVALARSSPLRKLLEPDGVSDVDWTSRWAVISRLLRATDGTADASPAARIVETRATAVALVSMLGPAALPAPDLTALGSGFEPAFDEWLGDLAFVLTSMSA